MIAALFAPGSAVSKLARIARNLAKYWREASSSTKNVHCNSAETFGVRNTILGSAKPILGPKGPSLFAPALLSIFKLMICLLHRREPQSIVAAIVSFRKLCSRSCST